MATMPAPAATQIRPGVGVYDSAAPRSLFLSELADLLHYRDLLRVLIAAIIRTRYKRSALGVVWTLLNPVLSMLVMSIAFSTVFRFSIKTYPVYLLSGLIFWNFFAQTTTFAMNYLVWGGAIIKRIYVPRTVFAVAAVGNGVINLGLSLVPLALIMLVLGQPIRASVLFVPVAALLLAAFSLGVALLVSALAVLFVDVVDMYQLLIQAWFFLTPVMYPREIIPARFVWLLEINPMYHLLAVFRAPLYDGVLPAPASLAAAAAAAAVSLLVGWWFFAIKADELVYRL